MNNKALITLSVVVALSVGFGVGRVSKPIEDNLKEVSATTEAPLAPEFTLLVEKYEAIGRKPILTMEESDRRFLMDATGEYHSECLYSVTDKNKVFCTRFAKALASLNDANDRARVQILLEE